jgi:hypothetical protein
MAIKLSKENVSYIHIEKLGVRRNKLDLKQGRRNNNKDNNEWKIRALELMLIIWQPYPLEKVSTNYFRLCKNILI